jgi:adenine C2-methylase RlmN of 23S rRNA A2503 and tRNA A37
MEVYQTKDGRVTKYVHDDGSETAIKKDISCDGSISVDNKYSVFISSSVGCKIGCKFCFLTTKNVPFFNLTDDQVFKNVIDAIKHKLNEEPSLKTMYIKLGWMGMGDPFLKLSQTVSVTNRLVNYLTYNKLCEGIDGVDIATTFPKEINPNTIERSLSSIRYNFMYNAIKLNSERHGRNPVRLFYSLHSGYPDVRKKLIPNADTQFSTFPLLSLLPRKCAEIIVHHIFLEDINDNTGDLDVIINMVNSIGAELRILRYNKCPHSTFIIFN